MRHLKLIGSSCRIFAVVTLLGLPSPLLAANGWPLTPDPAAEPAAGEYVARQIALPSTPQLVVFPQSSSPCVAMLMRNDEHTVWNLQTGEQIGKFSSKLQSPKSESTALSADGRWLATSSNGFSSGAIDIWDTQVGRLHRRIESGKNLLGIKFLVFAGNNRLLSYPGVQGPTSIGVWDTESGEAVNSLSTSLPLKVAAVSGGGRYLAVAAEHKNLMFLYDLTSGALLQQLEFRPTSGFWDDCSGLSFSPDGRSLAGLFVSQPSQLRVWNLETGALDVEATVSADPHGSLHGRKPYNGPAFVGAGDNSGWLCYGYFWVDRDSLSLVREFSVDTPHMCTAIRPLAMGMVAYAVDEEFRSCRLCVEPLPPTVLVEAADQSPLLKPGDAVAIDTQLDGVRFADDAQVKTECQKVLSERLTQLGMRTADSAQLTLKLVHRETAGKVLPRPRPLRSRLGTPSPLVEESPGPTVPQGSGFVISADGLAVTCAHVVGSAKEVTLKLGERQVRAQVLKTDEQADLALLKFEGKDEPCLSLRDSDEFELGEDVRGVGFPLTSLLGESLKVTKGSISGVVQQRDVSMFMIDAVVNPGNSGGPLIDQHGHVLGVNAKMLVGVDVNNVGLSVPINLLRPLLDRQKLHWPETDQTPLNGTELLKRLQETVAIVTTADSFPESGNLAEATDTDIVDELQLVRAGQDEPLWTARLTEQQSAIVIRGNWNDSNLRKMAFQRACSRLKAIDLPYYISADGTQMLPQRILLTGRPMEAPATTP